MSHPRTASEAPSRRRLIDAAKALLWQGGYEAMSPRRLLAASGLGQGSLYHHFGGKADIARTALAEIAEEMLAGIDATIAGAGTPEAALRAVLDRPAAPERGCRLGRLVNEEAFDDAALRAPVEAFFAGFEARLAALFAAAGRPRPDRLATATIALIEGGFVLARARRDPAPFHAAMEGARMLLFAEADATIPDGDPA